MHLGIHLLGEPKRIYHFSGLLEWVYGHCEDIIIIIMYLNVYHISATLVNFF